MRVFAYISEEVLPKRRMSQYQKNAYLFQHQGHTNKMDSEYLENHVWISGHGNDLDHEIVFWGFDSFAVVAITNTVCEWSNKH